MNLLDLREALNGWDLVADSVNDLDSDAALVVARRLAALFDTCPDPEGNGPAACWRCNGLGVVASELGKATSTTAGLAHLAEYLFKEC